MAKNDPSSALLKRFYHEFGTGGIQQKLIHMEKQLHMQNGMLMLNYPEHQEMQNVLSLVLMVLYGGQKIIMKHLHGWNKNESRNKF